MSTITKQWLQQKIADMEAARDEIPFGLDEDDSNTLAAMKLALASLEAEAVAYADPQAFRNFQAGVARREWMWRNPGEDLIAVYTAPPAPVALPVQHWEGLCRQNPDMSIGDAIIRAAWWNHCAAMLQGADTELQRKAAIHDALCEKYNVESLTDFVDWQRNHIAELEAAPPAPVGPGETAVMPDYPGYTMTQRECFDAGVKRAVPDGWVAVPVEPTEDMIVQGFESEPDESFSDEKEWEAYDAMSGCQQAAHRAKLCWAAMISAAPKSEMK
ncbi:hypothetical protein ACMGGQ_12655 [Enterobacter sp. BNK-13]|uniref:hypothetical protein n=1 Tax=Enterobacter sp. BNK-13 TaxID=3376150 RepID=UPI003B42F792